VSRRLASAAPAAAVLVLLLTAVLVTPGAGQSNRPTGPGGMPAPAALPGARVAYHPETGEVRFLTTPRGRPIPRPPALPRTAAPEAAARGFLAEHGALFGIESEARELRATRTRSGAAGRSFVRFQQLHRGVPVLAGELVVELDGARNIVATTGEILPDPGLDVVPAVGAAAARQQAIAVVSRTHGVSTKSLRAATPELWIYDSRLLGGPGLGRPALVWRTEVTTPALGTIRELVLVDAKVGAVALHFNQVEAIRNRATYTANGTSALPGTLKCGENSAFPSCAGGDADVEGTHRIMGDFYDYFWDRHGRDSFDDAGTALVATVDWRDPSSPGTPFDNVFWDVENEQMVVGDARSFAQADDVVAHELAHAITEDESKLFYYYQSGAINESLSDVFGELVDLTNGTGNDSPGVRWQLMEDVTPQLPSSARRDMKDPTMFGDPDRMTSPNYWGTDLDGGGVHSNSGVNNKAAYLMVDGDTFNGKTVTGIGITKASAIYYEAATNLLTSASDYQDLYNALQQACANLIGTLGIAAGDCQAVKDAIDAVEMNVAPPAAPTLEAPVCTTSVLDDLFVDDLENPASGNWTSGALGGTTQWFYPQTSNPYGFDATYARSGVTNFWGADYPDTTNTYVAKATSVAIPAGATYLRFEHAFSFDSLPDDELFYDGGVVEVSTNGGASWADAGPLFTHGGYTATISAEDGNPLAGRAAFSGFSRGYGSSRIDLSSLAGQNVRFRFRIGTDEIVGDYGWFIDDVRLYRCRTPPAAPTNVKAVAGNGEATVTFAAPFDGGSPIGSYTVTATPGGQTATTSGSRVAYVYGLANGTSYTFRVTATNAIGEGLPSLPSAPVTPDGGGRAHPAPPGETFPRPVVPDPPQGGTRVPPPAHQ
jgi:Zn-dependent metalloprotease